MQAKKGFTLIELLVVLAIVAILSVVVILTLNPAELLKQARDSNRLSDLSTMKSALSLYLADVSSPVLIADNSPYSSLNGYGNCFVSVQTGTELYDVTRCGKIFATDLNLSGDRTSMTSANLRKVDGTGWLPINLTSISSGAPLGNLPVDPLNNANYFYGYAATSTLTFELGAFLESAKYASFMSTSSEAQNPAYRAGTVSGLAL